MLLVEHSNSGSYAGLVEVLAHQLWGWVRPLVSMRLVGNEFDGLASSADGCVLRSA